VNVITREAPEHGSAHEVTVGGGGGPGERNALRAFALSSARLGRVGSYTLMLRYFQTDGPELKIADSAFINPPPEVWDSNGTVFGNGGTADSLHTSRYVSGMLDVKLGDFSLFAHVPWALRWQSTGPGGSIVASDNPNIVDDEMRDLRISPQLYLRYRKRTLNDRLGIQVTGSYSYDQYDLTPFRIWAAAPQIPGVPPGGVSADLLFRSERAGISSEIDAQLPAHNTLTMGLELYRLHGRIGSEQLAPIPSPAPYNLAPPVSRVIYTQFLEDEWRIVPDLALNGGLRYTGSDSFDPVVTSSAGAVWNITSRLYLRGSLGEGFRASGLDACCVRKHPSDAASFNGNPTLNPERSRALEGELNWITLQDVGPIDRLYVRLDYSYTTMSDVIKAVGGNYLNLGEQSVHSIEFLGRLSLLNRSSLYLSYYYVRPEDSSLGPIRFPANHIFSAAVDYRLLPWLALTSVFTLVGPREDLNRVADLPNNQATMNATYFERLDPYYLWRVGFVVQDLPLPVARNFELRFFVANLLNDPHPYAETDGGASVGSDKLSARSVENPGWTAFADLTYRIGGGGQTP
jgi:outer membrane receptor protein involved in Fe transport